MQKDILIDMGDAVVAVEKPPGNVKFHQARNLAAVGALGGAVWGSLIGLMFTNPLLGAGVGTAARAIPGTLADVGVNDEFMKDLAGTLEHGTSAHFVLVRKGTPDRVLEELKGYGGTDLKSSFSHEDEAKLQAAPG